MSLTDGIRDEFNAPHVRDVLAVSMAVELIMLLHRLDELFHDLDVICLDLFVVLKSLGLSSVFLISSMSTSCWAVFSRLVRLVF